MKQLTFILIKNQVIRSDEIIIELQRLVGIKSAHLVTGEYDVIATAELSALADLNPLISTIHGITGIDKTSTCLEIDNPLVIDDTFAEIGTYARAAKLRQNP